jgi:carbon monoxide dehydrogenase subunit G
MKLDFTERVPASPDRVFAALMDPAMIRSCADGLESMTPAGENVYDLRARPGLKGRMTFLEARPGESVSIAVEGKSLAGSLKGELRVRLRPEGAGTQVDGSGDVTVGGFLAALGPKMIESGGRRAVADFFSKLSARLTSSKT